MAHEQERPEVRNLRRLARKYEYQIHKKQGEDKFFLIDMLSDEVIGPKTLAQCEEYFKENYGSIYKKW